jgi:hypothetical protein
MDGYNLGHSAPVVLGFGWIARDNSVRETVIELGTAVDGDSAATRAANHLDKLYFLVCHEVSSTRKPDSNKAS